MSSLKTQPMSYVPLIETSIGRARNEYPVMKRSATRRQCGDCTACCTVMGVHSIAKKPWTECRHNSGGGCSIYKNRPASCRSFTCLWLADERNLLRDSDRPDKLGLVLTDVRTHDGRLSIAARELESGAAQRDRAKRLLEFLRQFFDVAVVSPRSDCTPITIGGTNVSVYVDARTARSDP